MTHAQDHPDHAAIHAAFPGVKLDGGGLTIAQGRLCFHQERLLFGRRDVATKYASAALAAGLPLDIAGMSDEQCRRALRILETVARVHPVIGRPPETGWHDFGPQHGGAS